MACLVLAARVGALCGFVRAAAGAAAPLRRNASETPGGRVLVSSLLYEDAAYGAAAVRNFLAFTAPSTPIVAHVAAGARDGLRAAVASFGGRVSLNPARLATHHGSGRVLLGHLSNADYAASLDLPFDYVLFASSKSRFFLPGAEGLVVAAGGHSSITRTPTWLAKYCERRSKKHLHRFFFDALFPGNGSAPCVAGFSQHEGAWFPRATALGFLAWLNATPDGENGTLYDRVARVEGAGGGQGAEEVFLQTWALARGSPAAGEPPLCAHQPPRRLAVGALDVVARRLGVALESPFRQLKRWAGGGDDGFLECLGDGDGAGAGDDAAVQATTLACVAAANLSLPRAFPRGPAARASLSLIFEDGGGGDPYPDLAALRARVAAWLNQSEAARLAAPAARTSARRSRTRP